RDQAHRSRREHDTSDRPSSGGRTHAPRQDHKRRRRAASGAEAGRRRANPGAGATGDAAALSRNIVRYCWRAQLDHRVSFPDQPDAGLGLARLHGAGLAPAAALIKVLEGCRLPCACYGCRSRNSLSTPSHRISGLRSPALASSMMRLAMISLVMTGRSARPSAMRAISNATPTTPLASGSVPGWSRKGGLGIRRSWCRRERDRSLRETGLPELPPTVLKP